jgi:glycosyltransferase involved in cell wall biosynthesis
VPADRLSLLIDGRSLGGAGARRGLGTYTRELVSGLASIDEADLAVLAPSSTSLPKGVRHVVLDERGPDRWATAEHQLRLASALRRHRPRGRGAERFVFHAAGQDPPRRVEGPWVQTVADLIPLTRREPAYAAERRRWQRWAGRIRTAEAVITFSHHSAAQLAEHLGVDPAKVAVAPLAAADRFGPAGAGALGEGPDSGAAPYVLSVGEYAPHKGYGELAELAEALRSSGLPHRIVVAGQLAPQWDQARERDLSGAGASARERIHLAGWVPDLVGLYQRADVVVSTSRSEGFGLPLVEAMACGAAVVAFANTAVPEVVGEGGVLVADGDVAAMADSVVDLIQDASAAGRIRHAALRRAAAFSWGATVAAHLDVYRSVMGARR